MTRKSIKPGIELGQVVREYSRDEAAALGEQWLAAFAPAGFGDASRQYTWHIFSSGRTPALQGQSAQGAYEAASGAPCVVLADDFRKAYLVQARPARSVLEDWLVFPPNLAWTMAFTHEDGWIGPFFARHPDHGRLDAENAGRLAKQQQMEIAKQRGWAA